MHMNTPAYLPYAFCTRIIHAVGQLRRSLRARYVRPGSPGTAILRRSLAEAEALAWETSFPHLFLPLLAEEKVRLAHALAPVARP